MTATLEDSLKAAARDAYTLWVGAGVSIALGRVGGTTLPNWRELVTELEAEAGLEGPRLESADGYAIRLDHCFRKLGIERFQAELREKVIIPLCDAIIDSITTDPIGLPQAAKQLAALGRRASPIVNFNIESLSSHALACGSVAVRAFNPPVSGAMPGKSSEGGLYRDQPIRRVVIHPHGLLTQYGICVLTRTQYEAMRGTLALQVAVHSAFGSNLLIVGMSLEDRYLRNHLAEFRDQINRIFWYTSDQPSDEISDWAWANRVEVISCDWTEFWNEVESILGPPSEKLIRDVWAHIVVSAASLANNPSNTFFRLMKEGGLKPEQFVRQMWAAQLRGETVDLDPPERANNLELISAFSGETLRLFPLRNASDS